MSFVLLKSRLLARLQQKVRNGEWTVRQLALRSGISQPHLHNALKGYRDLSMENADRLMQTTGLGILDLVSPAEVRQFLERRDLDPDWDHFRRRPTSQ